MTWAGYLVFLGQNVSIFKSKMFAADYHKNHCSYLLFSKEDGKWLFQRKVTCSRANKWMRSLNKFLNLGHFRLWEISKWEEKLWNHTDSHFAFFFLQELSLFLSRNLTHMSFKAGKGRPDDAKGWTRWPIKNFIGSITLPCYNVIKILIRSYQSP